MSDLRSLIAYAIIMVFGSLIIGCKSFHSLIIGEIDLPLFFTYQLSIGCILLLIYIEYYEYKNN